MTGSGGLSLRAQWATQLPWPTDNGRPAAESPQHSLYPQLSRCEPATSRQRSLYAQLRCCERSTDFCSACVRAGNWRGISRFFVPTRTPTQVASHAQKHFLRVGGTTKRRSRFAAIEEQLYKGGGLGAQSGLGPQKTITKADSAHGLGLPPRALAHSRSSSSQMLTEPQAPARAATAPQQQQGLGGSFGACDASVAEPTNAAWAGSTPQLPATLGQQERVWLGQQLVVWGVPGAAAGFAVAQQASSAQVAPAGVSQPAQASAPGGVTVVSGYPSGAFFSLPAYNQASMQPALGFPAPRSGENCVQRLVSCDWTVLHAARQACVCC